MLDEAGLALETSELARFSIMPTPLHIHPSLPFDTTVFIRLTSCLLILVTTSSSDGNSALGQELRALKTTVELKEASYKGATQLYGELNCGEVSSGERIVVEFDIINKSETDVEFHVLKPSCSCVDVKMGASRFLAERRDC
jgi:hypothetical protein